ncbi:MAG: hypothetical protein AB7Y46_12390 [Armatimonadota bacterium]
MRRIWALMALALIAVTPTSAGLQLSAQYQFLAGSQARLHVTAQIDGAQLGTGVPLAVTGSSQADVTLQVLSVDEAGVATVQASFGPVASELMGEAKSAPAPEPVQLRVDRLGRVLEASGGGDADLDLFASGGIPVQAVVVLGGIVELPDRPVRVGESWTLERAQQLPELGEVTVRTSSSLQSLDGAVAAVTTDVEANFPDFTAQNPLQGGEILVRNGVMRVQGMRRSIDARTGLPCATEATMTFDCIAAMGGLAELPITVNSRFRIEPIVEPAAEARAPEAARPPEATPQLSQPAPVSRGGLSTAQWVVTTLGRHIGETLANIMARLGRL